MRKLILIGMPFVMLFGLIGCSHSNDIQTEQNRNEINHEVNLTHNKKPPLLTITVGEEIIKAQQSGYNWRYFDEETGESVGIEVESLRPTEILHVENANSVDLKEPIQLTFEIEPIKYEIRVYNNNGRMITTYNDLKDIKEKGITIFEIVASWANGTANYVVMLDIQ